jgi:hypothetical protein
MNPQYSFIVRFLVWSACSFYLWRTALVPRNAEQRQSFNRSLRFLGALITLWLAIVALGRSFGLFRYVVR